MGVKHKCLSQYKDRLRTLLFNSTRFCNTVDTLHIQLITVHLKCEQLLNWQGMEIGE